MSGNKVVGGQLVPPTPMQSNSLPITIATLSGFFILDLASWRVEET
jgi:hypothetical protein